MYQIIDSNKFELTLLRLAWIYNDIHKEIVTKLTYNHFPPLLKRKLPPCYLRQTTSVWSPKKCSKQPSEILFQWNNSSTTSAEELTNPPSIPKIKKILARCDAAYNVSLSDKITCGIIACFKVISINKVLVKSI